MSDSTSTEQPSPPPGPSLARRLAGLAAVLLAVLLLAAIGLAAWGHRSLRASLPQLDGEARVPGLSAPVIVERDADGVPTIRGASRADVARAMGFLHAQDRFFQMDLLRRRAAGELAELRERLLRWMLDTGDILPPDRDPRLWRPAP